LTTPKVHIAMRRIIGPIAAFLLAGSAAHAATLQQTVHFSGASASDLFGLYMTADGQQQITGLPARYLDADGSIVARGSVGDRLEAFCFEPNQCGLAARILDIVESDGRYIVVMSWWNFGWASAADEADYTVEGRGAPDSTLVLTFADTPAGAEIRLVQANVPDYKVVIPNPDGSTETGPLSQIVNTHWNTLYWDGARRLTAK
jgi:hypothetical protein